MHAMPCFLKSLNQPGLISVILDFHSNLVFTTGAFIKHWDLQLECRNPIYYTANYTKIGEKKSIKNCLKKRAMKKKSNGELTRLVGTPKLLLDDGKLNQCSLTGIRLV